MDAMKKKVAAKKKSAPKKKNSKTSRIEKVEAVAAEVALKLRALEETVAALSEKCAGCCPPKQSQPQAPKWPYYDPGANPWYPIWHNVWTAVDYATAIHNKNNCDKNKYNKHPGDTA